MRSPHKPARLAVATAVLAGGLLAAVPAAARDGDVTKAGRCTGSSRAELKVGARDGGFEAEFEVDSNVVGQRWTVRMNRNGKRVALVQRRTVAPSGSFSYERRLGNAPGRDTIIAKATNAATGETCRAKLVV
jgi:hypothetical protein